MKTLVIIGMPSRIKTGLFASDFERPLNKRGERDAPVMAERLKNKMTKIDAFVSSKGALSTCRLFCDSHGADMNKIIQADELYHGSQGTFL